MGRVVQRPAARRDYIIHFAYLAENGSVEIARRFRTAVEMTYQDLAQMPRMGVLGKIPGERHRDVRLWRVRGFPAYLIAYRENKDGVAIERLIHAKQDYLRVLG